MKTDTENKTREEGKEKLAEYRRRKKKASRVWGLPRWSFRVVLILVLCVLLLVVWLYRNKIFSPYFYENLKMSAAEMNVGDGFPQPIKGDTVEPANFCSIGKSIVAVSDKSLNVLNGSGNLIFDRQHSYENPVVKTGDTRCLIYNFGGTGYQVESISDTVIKEEAKDKIILGDIAPNGRYLLITQEDNYTSGLSAYLSDGIAQYEYLFSKCYVTAAALSQDGTKGVVCGVFSENGALFSGIYLFDFAKPEPVATLRTEGNLILDARYTEDGTIICIGDTMTTILQETDFTPVYYTYPEKQLTAWATDRGKTALVLNAYAGAEKGELIVLDQSGAPVVELKEREGVRGVSIYANTVALLLENRIDAYDATSGDLLGSCAAGKDARTIVLRDEFNVYVLGISEIRYESIQDD